MSLALPTVIGRPNRARMYARTTRPSRGSRSCGRATVRASVGWNFYRSPSRSAQPIGCGPRRARRTVTTPTFAAEPRRSDGHGSPSQPSVHQTDLLDGRSRGRMDQRHSSHRSAPHFRTLLVTLVMVAAACGNWPPLGHAPEHVAVVGVDTCGRLAPHLEPVNEHADVLLIAGDLTKCGTPSWAVACSRKRRRRRRRPRAARTRARRQRTRVHARSCSRAKRRTAGDRCRIQGVHAGHVIVSRREDRT